MRLLKRLRWRAGFARAVLAQVRTGRPPEVRIAYERLRAEGVPAPRVWSLLVAAYEAEVAAMLDEERVHDHAAYTRLLAALPARPTLTLRDVPRRRGGTPPAR